MLYKQIRLDISLCSLFFSPFSFGVAVNIPTLPHIGGGVCVPCLLIDLRDNPIHLLYLTIPLLTDP